MKMILATLLTMAMSPFAMAEQYDSQASNLMLPEQVDRMLDEANAYYAEGNDSVATFRHRRDRRPPHYRPQPQQPRGVICYAQNARGDYFSAQGARRGAEVQQRRAMARCLNTSRYCYPMGCRLLW